MFNKIKLNQYNKLNMEKLPIPQITPKAEKICSLISSIGETKYKIEIFKDEKNEIIFEAYSEDFILVESFSQKCNESKLRSLGKTFKFCENLEEMIETLKNVIFYGGAYLRKESDGNELSLEFKVILPSGKQETILIKLKKSSPKKTTNNLFDILIKKLFSRFPQTIKKLYPLFIDIIILFISFYILFSHETNIFTSSSLITKNKEVKLLNLALSQTEIFKKIPIEMLETELIYSTKFFNSNAKEFHEKCNGTESTLVLIKTEENRIFGGFTTKSWGYYYGNEHFLKDDNNAFLFSFETMNYYPIINGKNAIKKQSMGPVFGDDITFNCEDLKAGNVNKVKFSSYSGLNEDYEINGKNKFFKVKQIDVIKISKKINK